MFSSGSEYRKQLHDEDYGLNIVANHNSSTPRSHAAHPEDVRDSEPYHPDLSPPSQDGSRPYGDSLTPQSSAASDGMRTRSGRSTRSTESPYSIVKTPVSKSPAGRTRREKKNKLDKSKMPKLTEPLSKLTRDMTVPLKDIEAWVNRPAEQRIQEVSRRNGYVTRPMNSFMLYRSAYADRTKQWCLQNNHQIVSSVSGASWPLEPPEIRSQYDEWAKIERANHQAAHPNYKFSPSKSTPKRRKANLSDDDDEGSDPDTDPDGEYRGGKTTHQRKQALKDSTFLPTSHPFEELPYYNNLGNAYDLSQYQIMGSTPTLPSNFVNDTNESPYTTQTSAHAPTNAHQQSQYPYVHSLPETHASTFSSASGSQSLGRYGLPSNHSSDRLLYGSRTNSPVQSYGQYIQPLYPQHAAHAMQYQPAYMGLQAMQMQTPMYTHEHQQYLLQASEPRAAIDPTLEAVMAPAITDTAHENLSAQTHFDDYVNLPAPTGLADSHDFFVRSVSPSDVNATLAPTWVPDEEL